MPNVFNTLGARDNARVQNVNGTQINYYGPVNIKKYCTYNH